MAKLKVMCARSMHVAVGALGKAFAEAAGHDIAFDFGTVGALQAKLDAGETADVVILSIPGIDKLEKAGALVPGSRRNVAKTFIAVCIREGAPKPDFATAEAFKRLLEGARAIAGQRSGGRRLGRRPSRQDVRAARPRRHAGDQDACRSRAASRWPSAWSRARPSSA